MNKKEEEYYKGHFSDCLVHNEPAFPIEECNCGLKDRIIENQLCAIEFLKAEIEKETKEHYELENCLWYLQNKCEKCVYKKAKAVMCSGSAQCLRCSDNYSLMFDEK